MSWALPVKLLSGERHKSPLMISQHWFRKWLGAIIQEAITWTSIDQDLRYHLFQSVHTQPIPQNTYICSRTRRILQKWDWNNVKHIENNVCTQVTNSFSAHESVYFPSCQATRKINIKITLEWVQKQFVMRVHTSSYFLHDIMNP